MQTCAYCNSKNVIRFGKRNEHQRYKCLDCKRTFTVKTKTIFSYSKFDRKTLIKLIKLILDEAKLDIIRHSLNISSRTAYMWRLKVYKAAGFIIKSTILSDIVWIDELLVPVTCN